MAREDHATTEQLRDDIDQGRTAGKLRAVDPAAAPLGTDEEAAGTPIDGKLIAEVRRRERFHRVHDSRTSQENDWDGVVAWVAIVMALTLAVGFAIYMWA